MARFPTYFFCCNIDSFSPSDFLPGCQFSRRNSSQRQCQLTLPTLEFVNPFNISGWSVVVLFLSHPSGSCIQCFAYPLLDLAKVSDLASMHSHLSTANNNNDTKNCAFCSCWTSGGHIGLGNFRSGYVLCSSKGSYAHIRSC